MKDYTKTKRITTAHHNVKSKICKAPKRATWHMDLYFSTELSKNRFV